MSTFDREFVKILKTQYENASDLNVVVADGLAYKIDKLLTERVTQGTNAMFILLKNGGGTKSVIPGVDLSSVTFYLTIACFQNELENVLSSIYSIARYNNAQRLSLTVNDDTVKYRAVFGLPTVERSLDLRLGESVEKFIIISQNIQVNYGDNAWVEGKSYKLKIDNVDYNLNGVIRQEMAFTPIYDTYQIKGQPRQQEQLQAFATGYVFTLMLIDGDKLQKKMRELSMATLGGANDFPTLWLSHYSISKNGTTYLGGVPIKTINYTETTENNVGTATLTLKY